MSALHRMQKTIYHGKKIARSVVRDCIEGFLYLLYLSTPPFSVKIFQNCLPDEIRPSTANMYLWRLYKRGYISKIKKGKNVFVSLIANFWEMKSDYVTLKRKAYQRGWDKKWRILIYDIPDTKKYKREQLRYCLKQLGFGMVQESCWVSCYDYSKVLYDFFKDKGILDYICIYEGKFYAGMDIDRLINRVWNLHNLFDGYQSLIEFCKESIEFIKTEDAEPRAYYQRYHKIYKEYRQLLYRDPFLPDTFVPRQLRKKTECMVDKLTRLTAGKLRIVI